MLQRNEKDAENILLKSGFAIGRVEMRYAPNFPPGTILSETPPPGSRVPPGTKIDLSVVGRRPPAQTK